MIDARAKSNPIQGIESLRDIGVYLATILPGSPTVSLGASITQVPQSLRRKSSMVYRTGAELRVQTAISQHAQQPDVRAFLGLPTIANLRMSNGSGQNWIRIRLEGKMAQAVGEGASDDLSMSGPMTKALHDITSVLKPMFMNIESSGLDDDFARKVALALSEAEVLFPHLQHDSVKVVLGRTRDTGPSGVARIELPQKVERRLTPCESGAEETIDDVPDEAEPAHGATTEAVNVEKAEVVDDSGAVHPGFHPSVPESGEAEPKLSQKVRPPLTLTEPSLGGLDSSASKQPADADVDEAVDGAVEGDKQLNNAVAGAEDLPGFDPKTSKAGIQAGLPTISPSVTIVLL